MVLYGLAVARFTAAAVAILPAFLTGFGSTLRVIFKIPPAVLATFATGFRCFIPIFGKIT
jgi:hypothetical protein